MKVYSCIAVDDEPLVLERLKKMFDRWNNKMQSSGFVLAGSCNSTETGVELALQVKPDIIITDIVMPGKNGIDLIAELKPKLPNTIFIILSAYPNFEYAKHAISLNVLEFLVKVPLNEQELIKALRKAKQKIDGQEVNQLMQLRLQKERLENVYRLRKQVMEEICLRQTSPSELERLQASLNIRIPVAGYMACMGVKIDRYQHFRTEYSLADQKLLTYGMMNIIEETVHQEGAQGFCCESGRNQVAIVVYWSNLRSSQNVKSRNQALAGRISSNIQQFLGLSISIGISSVRMSRESLSDAWKEVTLLLEDTFYTGRGSILYSKLPKVEQSRSMDAVKASFNQLIILAKNGDYSGLAQACLDIRRSIEASRIAPGELLSLYTNLAARLNHPDAVMNLEETDLDQYMDKLEQLCRSAKLPGHRKEREEIRKAKQFIESHLADKLYLEDIANYVNLNPAYFSKMFKREMKESLTEYINRRRIQQAVDLLEERQYSNMELAEAVGIYNERYFCTLFKRYTGTSPQKFDSPKHSKS